MLPAPEGILRIFHEIKRDLGWSNQKPLWGGENSAVARSWCWERYLQLSSEVYEEGYCKNLKRHAVSFTKGLPGASNMRVELHSLQNQQQLGMRVSRYLKELTSTGVAA